MKKIVLAFTVVLMSTSLVCAFTLASNDISKNKTIANDFVYSGMGCSGKNNSPELHWSGAPAQTKSFAITVYDPDAPTGSGFWHWIVYNIPAKVISVPRSFKVIGFHANEVMNDYGITQYGGPCPPPGKPHSYIFTIHAMKTEKLDIPSGATNAIARFMIEAESIQKATLTAKYGR
jgi:Raf kinase inhibitor-like YbhB/YbcL family protein